MANDRLLFPNLSLFKKEVTERFLVATREIYKRHPVYKYEDDDLESGILIYPSYGDTDYNGEKPKLVIRSGSYQLDLQDTFAQNMDHTIYDTENQMTGFSSWKLIDNTITILVRAYAEEESADIADELGMFVVYSCKGMYGQMGIDPRMVQVSETEMSDRENNVYQTTVSIRVQVTWEFERTDSDYVDDITVEPPEIDEEVLNGYRRPGVTVFPSKNKD